MGTTTTYSWPYPNLADAANGPSAFQAALQSVENTVKDTTLQTYVSDWFSDGDTQPSNAASRTGYYRVDNGICHFVLRLTAGASVSGGTGGLYLRVPLAPNATIDRQAFPCYIYIPFAGGGTYGGIAFVTNVNGTQLFINFPASSSDPRLSEWRNATNGNGPGTGIPLVPSWFGMVDGTEVVVSGSYFL